MKGMIFQHLFWYFYIIGVEITIHFLLFPYQWYENIKEGRGNKTLLN